MVPGFFASQPRAKVDASEKSMPCESVFKTKASTLLAVPASNAVPCEVPLTRILLALALACILPPVFRAAPIPLPQPMPDHPRLFANAAKFSELAVQIKTDPVSARIFSDLQRRADAMLGEPPVAYKKEGRRLLGVSREALARITALAMVARVTGDGRYAERAATELRAVSGFPDWNPSHFLDTAEMTLAVAVGYDWLYDKLDAPDREACARAIREKGILPSVSGPKEWTWWITGSNNWNQVCHAGMVAGAVAIADREPDLARQIIDRAVADIHGAADGYAPDGAYPEGSMYWSYGTTFQVVLIEALRSFTGSAHGLEAFPGFLESAEYRLQMVAPTGRLFNYSDCGTGKEGVNLTQYWFARETRRPDLLFHDNEILAASHAGRPLSVDPARIEALTLLWIDPHPDAVKTPPLSWTGNGPTPVAVFRSAWGDPQATFVGIKGGSASESHGHMDVGSFTLEADGVRWAVDPGMQDYYSLESKGVELWNGSPDGGRWKIFRLGPDAHNILRFDGALPLAKGRGEISRFSAKPQLAVVNLDKVYASQVAAVGRGVRLLPDRAVLIQDEWTAGPQAVEATWQMLTQADKVEIVGPGEVRLEQAGKALTLRVLAPQVGALRIAVEDVSAPRQPYDAPNPGLKRITLTTRTAAGERGTFKVDALPGSVSGTKNPENLPLSQWEK